MPTMRCDNILVDAMIGVLNTSVAVRIMRIMVQRERQRQRSKGVLRDTKDLTVTYIILVIYLIV